MSTNLITGYAGKSHITSAGDGAVNAAVLGNGRYVLDIAEKFAYELISNNQIRIKSGYAVDQGRKIELAVNDYEELTIDNGLQGVKRCDLIAITYEKNLETGIETATMNIIKGTSGDDYIDPEYTAGDIIAGDIKDDFLLYRLKLNGISVEAVEPLFEVRKSVVKMDSSENTTAFSMASARENLESGEKHNILFGKIAKWFADLKTVAFSGSYNDLSNKPTIPTVGNGKVTITQNGVTKGSFTMNQSGNTTVTLTDNNTTYDLSKCLALTGGTVTGTLVLSKTTDLSGTSDNRPALIVGGAATGVHIEIDNNEIHGKANGTTPNRIVINGDGGDVEIGDSANEYSTIIRNDLIVNKNIYPKNSIKMNQSEWLDCIVNYVDSNGAGRVDALRLIGYNSSGNVHMGGYSDITIAPVYLHASGKQYNFTDAAFCPNVTNNVHLGLASKLWKTVYAKTGTINTSDRNKKHDIKDLTEVYEQLFLKLQPKSFIFNDGDRVHIGAISQDVETAMQELGIEAKQFAGFCKDIRYEYTEFSEEDGMPIESSKVPCKDEDGNIIYDYALRYQEFISLTVHMVQRLWSRLDAIEKENAEIKEQIKSMQQDIEELKKVRA